MQPDCREGRYGGGSAPLKHLCKLEVHPEISGLPMIPKVLGCNIKELIDKGGSFLDNKIHPDEFIELMKDRISLIAEKKPEAGVSGNELDQRIK